MIEPSTGTKESPTDPGDGDVEDTRDPVTGPAMRGGRRELALSALEMVALVGTAAFLMLYPEQAEAWLSRLFGATAVLAGIAIASSAVRRPRDFRQVAAATIGAALGLWLVLQPTQSLNTLGKIVGLALLVGGLAGALDAVRLNEGRRRQLSISALATAVGAALWALPDELFTLALWITAILLAMHALLRTGVRLGLTADPPAGASPLLVRWIAGKGQTPQHRDEVYEQIFFEGSTTGARTARFALMMVFASVISAMGVMADSTAVVIGAMLVAPLISPMMGMGLSLAMGWPNRLARSALTVAAGIAIAVGTGAFLSAALDLAIDLESNTQITSRSSPTIADLIVAVGAGAAGAYALSRKDVSSSLPGVAVAIALVPPLSVVGIAAERHDWDQAAGTLLLFLTNLVAILVVGGAVFILTGVAPLRRAAENQYRVRTAASAIAALAILVVAGLGINGASITRDALADDNAQRVVADWLGDDTEFSIVSLDLDRSVVAVVLIGPGDPRAIDELAPLLADELGRRIILDLQWIPRQRQIVAASPTG